MDLVNLGLIARATPPSTDSLFRGYFSMMLGSIERSFFDSAIECVSGIDLDKNSTFFSVSSCLKYRVLCSGSQKCQVLRYLSWSKMSVDWFFGFLDIFLDRCWPKNASSSNCGNLLWFSETQSFVEPESSRLNGRLVTGLSLFRIRLSI